MIPLYSADQVRKADEYSISKLEIPGITLMENASRSIFNFILEKIPGLDHSFSFGILCGKGNNGGDGFALARHLVNDGFNVHVLSFANLKELKGESEVNALILNNLLKHYPASKLTIFKKPGDVHKLKKANVIIDAMLGTGAKGKLREPYKSVVQTVNQFDAYRVAVDLPSGLDVESSTGDVIFSADFTITLGELKTGLFYGKGYVNAGEVSKGYIGMGNEYFNDLHVENYLIEPEDAFVGIPIKAMDSHKYSAGKVLTIAGSGNLPGAACLTANSVLLAGGGASILAFPKSIKSIAQTKLGSAVVHSYEDAGTEVLSDANLDELKDRLEWADVIAIGPGLGRDETTQKAVLKILKNYSTKKFIIDADAVFALRKKYKNVNLKNKILTPHHKEFADLLNISVPELQNNLLQKGKEFAKQTAAYLVLKGAPTMIFTPKGETLINTTGNPGMSSFGVGDVLTGIIAAFTANGEDMEDSLISAVYIHSLAADLLYDEKTELGITAESLMDNLPGAIKFIEDTFV